MSTSTTTSFDHKQLAGRIAALAAGRAGLIMFAVALLTSASLLFSVQPLFAKMVLPHLGGSPSVWAVAMCFFQAALLAGYCYAHALNRFAPAWLAPIVHLVVCAAAALMLPFALPEWASEPSSGNTYLWLVSVLAVGVGLPFFATSANAPLLQAWFSRSGHPHASDPYFLYGASNLGSLVSLLSYPFLIEPMFGLDTQRAIWATGFGMLMLMLGGCAVLMLSSQKNFAARGAATVVDTAAKAITLRDRLVWIGLAFIPSALLVAFTTHITTDIASAPFLWVIPLATFLGTFVIVFRDQSMIPHQPVLRAHPILVASAIVFVVMPHAGGTVLQAVLGFATFVVTTLVSHRALYEARPEAAKLTEFYLYMSLGGVLGGMFAALIAPQLFNSVVEYPLLIILGLFTRPGVFAALRKTAVETMTPYLWGVVVGVVGGGVALHVAGLLPSGATTSFVLVVSLGLAVAITVYAERAAILALCGIAAVAMTLVAASSSGDGYSERSFFGVSRVMDSPDGRYRLLIHGSTIHGGQRLRDAKGAKIARPQPIMYYHAAGPMVRGFELARSGKPGVKLNTGVIGLGAGALACFVKPGEQLTYFEIDPVVVSIAKDPKHFEFLSGCAPHTKTILGDARLTLAKQPAGTFDYFVVDAFSSDAVPVHLLTQEAMELYLSRITHDGLIAFHISNRHMELESVVAATVAKIPGVHMAAVLQKDAKRSIDKHPSHVIYLSRDRATIERAMALPGARAVNPRKTAAWSDNYADILSAIWRRYAE
ncbi:MAG: fused MFS/spermidine synthase [Hyphomicrobiaceae bacterium]